MVLAALADRAGYAKPAHHALSIASQAPATKFVRPANSGPIVRNNGLDEHRHTSKFLEAMKNPNWRDRRTDSTSSSSNSAEQCGAETRSIHKTMSRARHWLASTSSGSAKVEPDNIANRKISASDRQFDVRQTVNEVTPRDGNHGSLEEIKGLCTLMRCLKINGSPSLHDGLCILEVSPIDATSKGGIDHTPRSSVCSPTVAKIQLLQTLPSCPPSQGLIRMEDYQLMPRFYLRSREKGQLQSSCGTDWSTDRSICGSASDAIEEAIMPTSTPEEDHMGFRPAPNIDHVNDSVNRREQKSSLDAKTIAFQKMLRKLNIRTSETGSLKDRDSSHETQPGSNPVVKTSPNNSHAGMPLFMDRKPILRRDKTVSDHAVSYGHMATGCHKAEGSTQFNYSSERLNPKAREFCSLKPDESADEIKRKLRDLQSSPSGTFNSSQMAEIGTFEPIPVMYGVVPQYADMGSRIPIQPGSGLNLIDPTVNPTTCPPQLSPLVGQPPLAPVWLAGILPRPRTSGTNSSSLYPITSSPFQSLPARFPPPIPAVPVQPLPVSTLRTSIFQRPAPVPKPKVPNAQSQQAYEAYIEQRKAMEPGYAMECKLRQQRRARRAQDSK